MDKIRPAHLMAVYKELSATVIRSKCHCKIDLKAYLKKHKTQKADLAQKANVSIAVLSSIFQGKNIDILSGKKISVALGGNYDTFFEDAGTGKLLSTKRFSITTG